VQLSCPPSPKRPRGLDRDRGSRPRHAEDQSRAQPKCLGAILLAGHRDLAGDEEPPPWVRVINLPSGKQVRVVGQEALKETLPYRCSDICTSFLSSLITKTPVVGIERHLPQL